MSIDGLTDDEIAGILSRARCFAVVGASPDPGRPSFGVATFLAAKGYRVTAVNPAMAGDAAFGGTAVASLAEAAPADVVDVFRRSEAAGEVVREAIRLKDALGVE